MSDLSYNTISGLKAVDAWMNMISANIGGSKRTGYKASRISFGGNVTPLDNRLVLPNASLYVTATSLNFSQGAVYKTGNQGDLAIVGDGYFVMVDDRNKAEARVFYTRDGEFNWDNNGILRNRDGLYVTNGDWNSLTDTRIPPWIGVNYDYRTTVTTGALDTATAGQIVELALPAGFLTNLVAEGKLQSDYSDLRLGYWDGLAQQDFFFEVVGSNMIRFITPVNLAGNDNFYIYYGNQTDPVSHLVSVGAPAVSFALGSGTERFNDFGLINRRDNLNLANSDEIDKQEVNMAIFPNQQGLEFSNYGTTIFKESQYAGWPVYFTEADASYGFVELRSLEESNATVTEYIPTLAMAQRFFSAMAKLINIHNSLMDDSNALMR